MNNGRTQISQRL